jgi:pimeloyl-ACP methyl ester carboxylesterase
MPYARTDDGLRLYYEETGSGHPLIFVHEFAGDFRSFEQQLRHFGKRYRAIAFNARGFPPSDVPEQVSSYSQARAADDILSILDHVGENQAHIVGLSMGGFATLHFGFRHHDRVSSLCIGGCGYGAELEKRDTFRKEADLIAAMLRTGDMPSFAERYSIGPTRVQFQNKDPRGFAEFKKLLAEHSPLGSANTQSGVQKERPSLYHLVEEMKRITAPTLVIMGDEDWPCLLPGLLMSRISAPPPCRSCRTQGMPSTSKSRTNTITSSASFLPRWIAADGPRATPGQSAPRSRGSRIDGQRAWAMIDIAGAGCDSSTMNDAL